MNSIMERWIQTCRRELLDRTLIWNQSHLLHALREFETFTTSINRTERWSTPLRSARYPSRSARQDTSATWRSTAETASAEPFTSTDMLLDQAG